MLNHPTWTERFAFGRPLDTAADTSSIRVPRSTTALVGRILIAAIFVISGTSKLADPTQTAVYMTSAGIPAAHSLAIVAGLGELLGGLMLMFGFLTRIGALGLALFLIPTTLLFHRFWALTGQEAQMQLVNFLKNMAIMGGLYGYVAFGAGRFSIDAKLRTRRSLG